MTGAGSRSTGMAMKTDANPGEGSTAQVAPGVSVTWVGFNPELVGSLVSSQACLCPGSELPGWDESQMATPESSLSFIRCQDGLGMRGTFMASVY